MLNNDRLLDLLVDDLRNRGFHVEFSIEKESYPVPEHDGVRIGQTLHYVVVKHPTDDEPTKILMDGLEPDRTFHELQDYLMRYL